MFTSTNPSPRPSPRLGGERELFPFDAFVEMRPLRFAPDILNFEPARFSFIVFA